MVWCNSPGYRRCSPSLSGKAYCAAWSALLPYTPRLGRGTARTRLATTQLVDAHHAPHRYDRERVGRQSAESHR